jgi:hypothetical protein
MSTSTSSPVSECPWRKEVESPYLIFLSFVSDDHWCLQQIPLQFMKRSLSLNSYCTGVSWSSCNCTNGWIPSCIHLLATKWPQLAV